MKIFFLFDITLHLNDLIIKLQRKGKLIFNLFAAVNVFKAKLNDFKSQLLRGILAHFPICLQRISQERLSAVEVKYANKSNFFKNLTTG